MTLTTHLHRTLVSVLLLLSFAIAATAQTADTPLTDGPLVDALRADGRFTTLADALQKTGLAASLDPATPVTLFAPTDEAFAALPEGLLAGLSDDDLRALLLAHVVAGDVTADAARDAGTATTASGTALTFEGTDALTANGAAVTVDAMAVEGVRVHAVDAVLLPTATAPTDDVMEDAEAPAVETPSVDDAANGE